MWFATMTIAPVGAAFGVPVLALAVRRYTHRPGCQLPHLDPLEVKQIIRNGSLRFEMSVNS